MSSCFVALRDARRWYHDSSRELLIMLGPLRFLAAVSFYTLSSIFIGFLERAFQFDDRMSTYDFGLWGATNTVFTFAGGWLCDAVGVRHALAIGAFSSTLGFLLLSLTYDVDAQFWLAMYVLIPIGIGLGLPVCDVANRRLSSPVNEYAVYPLAYSVATLGQSIGLAALAITSAVYIGDSRRHDSESDYADYDSTIERIVLAMCAATSLILCVSVLVLNAQLTGKCIQRAVPPPNVDDDGDAIPASRSVRISAFMRTTRESLMAFRSNSTFRRVALFVLLTLPARHVFILLYTTLAIYVRRTLGNDVPVYAFMMIDPGLEFLLAPAFALLLPQIDIYWMMLWGVLVASVGLSGLVLLEPTMLSLAMSLTVFAIGSAAYVPRIPQYVLVQAPDGHEGRFAALASALPIVVGKFVVAIVFGSYLEKTCPPHASPEQCSALWTPSVFASFFSFVLLLVCKPLIHTSDVQQRFASRLEIMREATGHVDARSAFE